MALGDALGARELHEEVLAVCCRVLGEEHPDTLTSMNNLAESLRALGDALGAWELHREALAARRRVLGEEHPATLNSIHNLCCVLEEGDGMEVDQEMVKALLEGVRKLPEGTPIRVAAEKRWGPFGG